MNIEEQISVAKYNPYQSIQLYKESSITDEYETTMYDVVSLYYPNGGYGDLNADVLSGANTLLIKKEGFEGDICIGATVGVRNKSTGVISDTGRTVLSSALQVVPYIGLLTVSWWKFTCNIKRLLKKLYLALTNIITQIITEIKII